MNAPARPYRSKTIKPCDACRRRRVACIRSGGDTACSLCKHRGKFCTYFSAAQVRKPVKRSRTTTASTIIDHGPSPATGSPATSSVGFMTPVTPATLAPGSSRQFVWPRPSTVDSERTFLYAGSSSDHVLPIIDSRINFWEKSDYLGDATLVVWKVGCQPSTASYLTAVPNSRLDLHNSANSNTTMYTVNAIEALYRPYHAELIGLYYQFVHPSYPILGCCASFEAWRRTGHVPGCLLAVVYMYGTLFWKEVAALSLSSSSSPSSSSLSPPARSLPDPPIPVDMRAYIFSCITSSCQTPNLAVIQAALLFMQFPAPDNEPSFTGIWGLVTMVVGMAQDIGLHVDPEDWNITAEEKGLRRVIWWAVFIHDVWMAYWLGRPPHVTRSNWTVRLPTADDFGRPQAGAGTGPGADDDVAETASSGIFIALCELSLLLSEVVETFYSVQSSCHEMATSEALDRGRLFLDRLHYWSQKNQVPAHPVHLLKYKMRLASCAVRLAVLRAIHGASYHSAVEEEERRRVVERIGSTIRDEYLPVLASIKEARPLGLWLIYIKGSLAITSSLLVRLLVSSSDESELIERHTLLLAYRDRLRELDEQHIRTAVSCSFTGLPLRRLDKLLDNLLGKVND